VSGGEDGIRDRNVTGVQTCALPISVGIPIACRQVSTLWVFRLLRLFSPFSTQVGNLVKAVTKRLVACTVWGLQWLMPFLAGLRLRLRVTVWFTSSVLKMAENL